MICGYPLPWWRVPQWASRPLVLPVVSSSPRCVSLLSLQGGGSALPMGCPISWFHLRSGCPPLRELVADCVGISILVVWGSSSATSIGFSLAPSDCLLCLSPVFPLVSGPSLASKCVIPLRLGPQPPIDICIPRSPRVLLVGGPSPLACCSLVALVGGAGIC